MHHSKHGMSQMHDQARSDLVGGLDLSFIAGRATITVEEFARLSGIGRTSAYAAARRGEIPVRWIGRRALVPVPMLLDWLGASEQRTRHTNVTGDQPGGSLS